MPIYMNYGAGSTPEIKGDVDDPQHTGWIELSSLQWGVGRSISSPTGGSSEKSAPKTSEIVVTKAQDCASMGLFRESLQGEGKKVKIDFVRTDGPTPFVYLTITLSGVLISGYSQGRNGKGPGEALSLTYTSIEWGPAKGVTPHGSVPPDFLRQPASMLTK
jgi:type VI secretion system secreted protein Hcp